MFLAHSLTCAREQSFLLAHLHQHLSRLSRQQAGSLLKHFRYPTKPARHRHNALPGQARPEAAAIAA